MSFYKKLKNKYGANKVSHAGLSFTSKLEAAVYDILWWQVQRGEINNLQMQKRVYLVRGPDVYYIPDFYFEVDSSPIYAEAKGFETPEWKIKKKLWHHFGPAPLQIYQGSYTAPRLVETIIPKGEFKNV